MSVFHYRYLSNESDEGFSSAYLATINDDKDLVDSVTRSGARLEYYKRTVDVYPTSEDVA